MDKLDKISGRKTIAAKMTDVPGHTIALVPLLAKHGVKLLHIGINTAAAYPDVPECFLWKLDGAEVVVIYASGYGGEFKCPYIDEILYFDNAPDNHGARNKKAILETFDNLKKKYPDYKVRAGRLDDIAESLWAVRDKLPVLEEEIGDTWIHGVSTDPYKTGAYRSLCKLKANWLADGSMTYDSDEYKGFADALLCVAEHTWGQDMKMHLGDTQNYDKKSFQKARKKNLVRVWNVFGDIPYRLLAMLVNTFGDKHYRYSHIEKSWAEQRAYIDKAIECLNEEHRTEAKNTIVKLLPNATNACDGEKYSLDTSVQIGDYVLVINNVGGINLTYKNNKLLSSDNKAFVTYRSYGAEDFARYGKQYMRHRQPWAVGDNLRPGLKGHDHYMQGEFEYKITNAVCKHYDNSVIITADFNCDKNLCEEVGAPRKMQVQYTLDSNGLQVKLVWLDKDAVRSTESLCTHFYPSYDSMNYVKIGSKVMPEQVVSNGGRKLSVIEMAQFEQDKVAFSISSTECALVASDGGNLLNFDNKKANIKENGLSFVLHDNVWGTNFPLWYEDNAMFNFSVSVTQEK